VKEMDGFQRRREQKKQSILEAALALFMKHGIQKVSIAEIAKAAKVSQVTIYNYFESKHNLTHDTFIYYVDTAMDDFRNILDANIPFPEKIKTLIFKKKEAASQIHDEFYQYIMSEYTKNPYFAKSYTEKALPYLNELISEGKEQGYIDPNLSTEAISFYLNMFTDYLQREDVYQSILPLTEDITNIFFYGLIGKR
jgi:AcrR family transcriptional regulator